MSTLAVTEVGQTEQTTLSWGAVIAGGVTAAALSLFLLFLGIGLGLSSVSPWAGEGVSATTFKVGAGVYLVAVAILASAVGGYLSGRLRHVWPGVHHDEIYFRDTAHGLVAWALATLLTAIALGGAITHVVSGAAGGAAPAATAGAGMAARGQPTDIYVDTLFRTDPTSTSTAASPAAQPGTDAAAAPAAAPQQSRGAVNRGEVTRILVPALGKGDISPADRTYLAKLVAARTGLSQADAEKRVNDTIAQAKKATDDARKATATMMLWLAASLLAGAVASMLGATEGGVLRDSKWYEPGWSARTVRNH